MIEKTHFISEENGYKRYNHFEISEGLQEILDDEYFLYDTKKFKKQEFIEKLYKKNFTDKYDRKTQKEVFKLYIDNNDFKKKAQFIYSIIDYDKYKNFVLKNPELENPNELTIKYSILDSEGVKVQIYFISIVDISFVF